MLTYLNSALTSIVLKLRGIFVFSGPLSIKNDCGYGNFQIKQVPIRNFVTHRREQQLV
jgi:hypothetical protein